MNGDDRDAFWSSSPPSSSEMDLASSSASPTPEPRKRKRSPTPPAASKKARRGVELSPELWQQVFLHLPPAALGRCLSVSKSFNSCLTTSTPPPPPQRPLTMQGNLHMLSGDAIWVESRRSYLPTMPKPMAGFTQLAMFQLLAGKTCMSCGKVAEQSTNLATSAFDSGPGPDRVAVLWSLRTRLCGPCIAVMTSTDIEVLQSDHSRLHPGLPCAFITLDKHYVPDIQRSTSGGIPSSLRVSRVYSKADIQELARDYADALSYGDGAAEEWLKGLHSRAKQVMADAARFERWESQIRHGKDLWLVIREYDPSSFPLSLHKAHDGKAGVTEPQPAASATGKLSLSDSRPLSSLPSQPVSPSHQVHDDHSQSAIRSNSSFSKAALSESLIAGLASLPPRPAQSAGVLPSSQELPRPTLPQEALSGSKAPWKNIASTSHGPKTAAQVAETRATRRAEIQRRCLELQPPLKAQVLYTLDAFRAAMMIARPLNDVEWDNLRPRLLDQRAAGDIKAAHAMTANNFVRGLLKIPPRIDSVETNAQETEKQHEIEDRKIKYRLGPIARSYIADNWDHGRAVGIDNCPAFAAATLHHVCQEYRQSHDSNGTRAIIGLQDVRWVWDTLVHPWTKDHYRENFICADCVEGIDATTCSKENLPKWYTFEGLVQHFGAKHSDTMGNDNTVIDWYGAEWPDPPPFSLDPGAWLKREQDLSPEWQKRRKALQAREIWESEHDELAQLNKLCDDVSQVWNALDGVTDLPDCVRVVTTLYHAVQRFHTVFHKEPLLDTLSAGLVTSGLMRDIKNAKGLACGVCVSAQTDGSQHEEAYYARVRNVKLFTLSSLINHFSVTHMELHMTRLGVDMNMIRRHEDAAHWVWTRDMIERPDLDIVGPLLTAEGIDENKIALITAAFPDAATYRAHAIRPSAQSSAEQQADSELAARMIMRAGNKKKKGSRKKAVTVTNDGGNGDDNSPAEDEYDPRRPMLASRDQDEARFDTDVARKQVQQWTRPSVQHETSTAKRSGTDTTDQLSALPGAQRISNQFEMMPEDYTMRSPSVGAAEPTARSLPHEPISAPDISSILAALTGKALPSHQVASSATEHQRRAAGSDLTQENVNPRATRLQIDDLAASSSESDSQRFNQRHDPQAGLSRFSGLRAQRVSGHDPYSRPDTATFASRPEPLRRIAAGTGFPTPSYQPGQASPADLLNPWGHRPSFSYDESRVQHLQPQRGMRNDQPPYEQVRQPYMAPHQQYSAAQSHAQQIRPHYATTEAPYQLEVPRYHQMEPQYRQEHYVRPQLDTRDLQSHYRSDPYSPHDELMDHPVYVDQYGRRVQLVAVPDGPPSRPAPLPHGRSNGYGYTQPSSALDQAHLHQSSPHYDVPVYYPQQTADLEYDAASRRADAYNRPPSY